MCKKRKLNIPVNNYTYPSPNKAIQQSKFELNNKNNSKAMQENDLKNLATEKLPLTILMCLMTIKIFLVTISPQKHKKWIKIQVQKTAPRKN